MEKGFAPIYLIAGILLIAIISGAYYLGIQQGRTTSPALVVSSPTPKPSLSPSTIPSPSPSPTPTPKPVQNGASLGNIKYSLSAGWTAGIKNDSGGTPTLYLTASSGSWIAIQAFNYPSNIGRREYYCQLVDYCIEGTTYFTATNIGNIDGYEANALDNSGGGAQYFGAKGNRFYIISKSSGLNKSDFLAILNTLVF